VSELNFVVLKTETSLFVDILNNQSTKVQIYVITNKQCEKMQGECQPVRGIVLFVGGCQHGQ
jgi:hypothetical protein